MVVKKGHDTEKAEKIWRDWEAFAAYAFVSRILLSLIARQLI